MNNFPELEQAVDKIFRSNPRKIVVSAPRSSENEFQKVVISLKLIGGVIKYQAEQFTKTQVFHRNMDRRDAPAYLAGLLANDFRQANSFSDEIEYNLRLSKKDRVMLGKHLTGRNKKQPVSPFQIPYGKPGGRKR